MVELQLLLGPTPRLSWCDRQNAVAGTKPLLFCLTQFRIISKTVFVFICFLLKILFHTIYSDHDFPSPISSQTLSTSSLTQLGDFLFSLNRKQTEKKLGFCCVFFWKLLFSFICGTGSGDNKGSFLLKPYVPCSEAESVVPTQI